MRRHAIALLLSTMGVARAALPAGEVLTLAQPGRHEVELCVVIGRRSRHVPAAQAREVVAGYMVANDFTLRDWQIRSPTMTMGKSFDTTGPVGPWLVTDDEIADPHALTLSLHVNGELRQRQHNFLLTIHYLRLIRDITSARLETFVLNSPRTELVTVRLPGLRTPRIVIQVCVASSTTTTPLADSSSTIKSAI